MSVDYALEPELDAQLMIAVLQRSGLAERRPVDDPERIGRMIEQADIVLTARVAGVLVGISRAITDFSYCCYLSDLAVDRDYQGQGIGRELIRRTHETAGLKTLLLLLSAPGAASYYPHIGMQRHESCWVIPRSST